MYNESDLKIGLKLTKSLYISQLMKIYDQKYREQLERKYIDKINSNYNNRNDEMIKNIILQSNLNVRLLELELPYRAKCQPIKRDCEFQTGFFEDNEYKEFLEKEYSKVFCKFKFVIGINDFKIRVEMSAIIDDENEETNLIYGGYFDGNILIYFNDIKIDSRELQGNSGDSEDMIYDHFKHIFDDKDYFIDVYGNIIGIYMEEILKYKQ